MFRRLVIAGVALMVLFGVAIAAASLPPGGSFVDDDGNIHEPAIEAIAAEGITRGCNPPVNDRYCPADAVRRGQMAAFLVRALGLTDRLDDPFSDDDGHVFEADIEKLAAAGITKGCNPPTNDLFCPNASVTRGQMAAFLVRAMGYTDAGDGDLFVDDDGSVFEGDIDRLGTAGVTKGCNPPVNDRFCPDAPVLRDQMASFLTRALGLTPITPPPPTSSTSTTTGGTGTTLPPYGPSATFKACGTSESGEEFSLEQECVAATVYNETWANSLYTEISYRWLNPNGTPVGSCPVRGSCVTVDYHYVGSSLIGWTMYFYVDGENRDPGWYTLEIWQTSPYDELLLRDHFQLSDIPPVDASTTTTTTTTTLPPREDVAWDCVVGTGDERTCTGDIDTLDAAVESWSCTPTESGYPDYVVGWSCSGDIDKRTAGDETWSCDKWGGCSGNVDTTDDNDESWSVDQVGSTLFGGGDIDKSVAGWEDWYCEESYAGMACHWDSDPYYITAWTCDGNPGDGSYGSDWSCSGDVGRLAPMVGPVPLDYMN